MDEVFRPEVNDEDLFCAREVEGIDLEEVCGELRTVNRWIGEWGEDIVSVPGADPLAMMQQLRSLSERQEGVEWGRVGEVVGCGAGRILYSIKQEFYRAGMDEIRRYEKKCLASASQTDAVRYRETEERQSETIKMMAIECWVRN